MTTKTVDVIVENHGTVFLFHLYTPDAREWVELNVDPNAMFFGDSLTVEHRYAYDLAMGMLNDGLTVR